MRVSPWFIGVPILLVVVLLLQPCSLPTVPTPERGSHGYRIWSGDTLVSFDHRNKRICIPKGWESLGARSYTDTWARYERGKTGLLIRSDAFASLALTDTITLMFPTSLTPLEIEEYERTIRQTLTAVSDLFPTTTISTPHTILITAGITGSDQKDESVYPDPNKDLTFFILKPRYHRAEELFTHALMHLHNRFLSPTYTANQAPLPMHDFEELEASWAELALTDNHAGRVARIDYLYRVHEAVRTRTFTPMLDPIFSDPAAFASLREGIAFRENGSFMEAQYGHYILAPLTMLAIEALLSTYNTGTNVQTLLTHVHTSGDNFFERLAQLLPEHEMQRVYRWMNGTETIDRALVDKAIVSYDR